jgi:integrase/recombinase XerD
MITTLIATGLRVSELTSLTRADARQQATGPHIHCIGMGRKERSTPLAPAAASAMKDWLEHTTGQPADPLFPARGRNPHPLTRDAIQARLGKYQQTAILTCPVRGLAGLLPGEGQQQLARVPGRRRWCAGWRGAAGIAGR